MEIPDTYYKGHIIEWIDYLFMYRVYQKDYPNWTCFYADTVLEAKEGIDFNLKSRR